ncbi:MAG TPA: hypothetical protein VEV17_02960 [Bryobacteraceae bacterium]|nr:hypothetical protein [Bryobacteraceae bacterium]
MQDMLLGKWKLNVEKSEFDPNHRPRAGTMVFEFEGEGRYLMKAEGVSEKGENVAERPARIIPDGKEHPVPDFPGLTAVARRPDPNTITAEVRREDGSVVGGGSYVVSQDGKSLVATTFGYDSQLRQFKQRTVWDRQ